MRHGILTAATLMVAGMATAGCLAMSEPDTPARNAPEEGETETSSCAPGVLERLVGQPESVLEVVDLPENTRVLHVGAPATTDHRPERVNIEIGTDGHIVRVWCG